MNQHFIPTAHQITIAICASLCTSVVHAVPVFEESFEDGNYSSDPAWSYAAYTTSSFVGVAPDPLDASNLALRVHGTDTGHRGLTTSDVNIPSAGLDWTFRVMGNQYRMDMRNILRSDAGTAIEVWLQMKPTRSYTLFRFGAPGYDAKDNQLAVRGSFPNSEWWDVHVWYDSSGNRLNATVADHTGILSEHSYQPLFDWAGAGTFNKMTVVAQETVWQWTDDIMVQSIPEPATLFMLALGGLVALRMYRHAA